MTRIQYSRITVSRLSPFFIRYKTFLFFLFLLLINIQVSSFYTLEEGEFGGGGEDEKSLNSLDFYSPSLGAGGGAIEEHDPLMPGMAKGRCNTLTSNVHVTKEEKGKNGLVYRICEGDITVSKCEGTCNSQLKPSVASQTGFKKVNMFLFINDVITIVFQ